MLGKLGSERAWVVHGEGLDELTTTGTTYVAELDNGKVETFEVTPEMAGLKRAPLAATERRRAGRERGAAARNPGRRRRPDHATSCC